jgi:DNA-directed RNA polymerase specialized sigma24 family protein
MPIAERFNEVRNVVRLRLALGERAEYQGLMARLGTSSPQSPGFVPFPSTQWTTLLDPIRKGEPGATVAIEQLCRCYWNPIYSYIRLRGYDHHSAEELTQEFLTSMLRRDSFGHTERTLGRFRTFLSVSLKNFLASEYRRATAQKRGGKVVLLSVEEAGTQELVDHRTAAKEFDKKFADSLLQGVFQQMEADYRSSGRLDLYNEIKDCLSGSMDPENRADIARRHGMKPSTMDVAIHRLRKRFRILLRNAVAATVEKVAEIDEELEYLMQALRGS